MVKGSVMGMGRSNPMKAWLALGLALGLAMLPVCAHGEEWARPFETLCVEEIWSVELRIAPWGSVIIEAEEDLERLVLALRELVIYEPDAAWMQSDGQYIGLVLNMVSGQRLELGEYNPFFIIAGQGYQAEYEPCEVLGALCLELVRGGG